MSLQTTEMNGRPMEPAKRVKRISGRIGREPDQVTRVAKKLLRLSTDVAQWAKCYDVLAWAHNQALAAGHTDRATYQRDTLSAARSICEAEVNVRQQELEGYLDLTLGAIADRLL